MMAQPKVHDCRYERILFGTTGAYDVERDGN